MKVLILEKDKTFGESLYYFLRYEKNFEVFLTSFKKEGQKLFESIGFDIIFCSDILSDGDGLDFLRKSLNRNPKLITIFMTVKDDEQAKKEAFKLGVKGFLIKPFNLWDLEITFKEIGV